MENQAAMHLSPQFCSVHMKIIYLFLHNPVGSHPPLSSHSPKGSTNPTSPVTLCSSNMKLLFLFLHYNLFPHVSLQEQEAIRK